MTNKKILIIFICLGLIITTAVLFVKKDTPSFAPDVPKPLTEDAKRDVLKSLEVSTTTTSTSSETISDKDKQTILESLTKPVSTSTTSQSASPASQSLSDEEKEMILKSLEGR